VSVYLKNVIFYIFLVFSILGCGDDEAEELLSRLLRVVGIPYEMVVNICQDSNNNGLCEEIELQVKIVINQEDTAESILKKIQLNPDGTYLLEHYDPTKKILMEIEDNEAFHNTGQRVTLPFEPKDPEIVKVQELSILQALIDNALLQEEEVQALRESMEIRSLIDPILLENLFFNQTLLQEHNVSSPSATILNLEYIAEGLRDINVSGDFVSTLESCEDNSSCLEEIRQDVDEQTQMTEVEAEVIVESNSTEGTGDRSTLLTNEDEENEVSDSSTDDNATESDEGETSNDEESNESVETTSTPYTVTSSDTTSEKTEKQVADGYIIDLSAPVEALCPDGNSYYSSMSVGAKGLIEFEGIALPTECNITVLSGATIDSNNNGLLDSTDKAMNFDMKASADASFISPLTTLLMEKIAISEESEAFKVLVKDFDPVAVANEVVQSSGVTKERMEKLMMLVETSKTVLDDGSFNLSMLDITSVVDDNVSFEDFSIEDLTVNLSGELKDKVIAKSNTMKELVSLLDVIDTEIIDLNTLIIGISDGGLELLDAFKNAIKSSSSEDLKLLLNGAQSIEELIPNILNSGYTDAMVSDILNGFSVISGNLQKISSGDFAIQWFSLNSTIETNTTTPQIDLNGTLTINEDNSTSIVEDNITSVIEDNTTTSSSEEELIGEATGAGTGTTGSTSRGF